MRSHIASRLRSSSVSSLSAIPPPQGSAEYSPVLARAAASILYRSPELSQSGLPIYIVNAAALPDAQEVDFDALLPYVLARLPDEEELLTGTEYEVIFFAGGNPESSSSLKKDRPGWGWFIQAYHVLSRAMRKRIQKLYIVHERTWVRILVEMFSTIVSSKFRKKIEHIPTLSRLALRIPIEDLLIPPSAYLHDRRLSPDIHSPYQIGKRGFSVKHPLPKGPGGRTRLPRVLRETSSFILFDPNVRTEGIFRIPPNSRLKEILQEAYSRGQKYIVWKDNGLTLPTPAHLNSESTEHMIEEVDQRDSYSVHQAAGLCKSWYTKLQSPIFPTTTYPDLRRDFSDPHHEFTLQELVDMFSPQSEWSKLPALSREIVTRHLLPLLSRVIQYQEENKMTAENLAVCFAPALLCGPDQIEDAKMSSIIRRILGAAIGQWSHGLRQACGVESSGFERDIRAPEDPSLYEDPLERYNIPNSDPQEGYTDEKQFTGIVLQDNETESLPPPLPPRPSNSNPASASRAASGDAAPRRKPVPSLATTSISSTIVADKPTDVAESPASYISGADGLSSLVHSEKGKEAPSGTEGVGSVLPVIVPKRKALTTAQIIQPRDKVETSESRPNATAQPAHLMTELASHIKDMPKRKPLQSASGDDHLPSSSPVDTAIPCSSQARSGSLQEMQPTPDIPLINPPEFRKPSWPASARKSSVSSEVSSSGSSFKSPTISSLARPVYSGGQNTVQQPMRSPTLPVPSAHRPRTPSPGLLRRMPSFEPQSETTALNRNQSANRTNPRKLDLKVSSVDELRRLYEDRAGTAQTLVQAGRRGSTYT